MTIVPPMVSYLTDHRSNVGCGAKSELLLCVTVRPGGAGRGVQACCAGAAILSSRRLATAAAPTLNSML
jgi:hypothetical protein